MQDLDKLIEDHWNYIEGILKASRRYQDTEITEIKYHYRTAFKHGFKHAKEEETSGQFDC